MDVKEVLGSSLFHFKLDRVLFDIKIKRGQHQFKRNPIDELRELNLFNCKSMTIEFSKVLDKSSERSSAMRKYIYSICINPFKDTVIELNKAKENKIIE